MTAISLIGSRTESENRKIMSASNPDGTNVSRDPATATA
ncbi:hypothetical protein FHX73_13258 [Kitasatospora viridis]|uniref:Uncharacterized protein n=1 Tax=Kitasatospora viridis TaxID=281105 RepID=A0A561TSW7_9ACTN|nr:hypothetical protein FHX73_13258 [Kitasatospora viridis]